MEKLKDRIAVLLADIEDPSLIMESHDLDPNAARIELLEQAHSLLYDLHLKIEALPR